MADTFDLIVIGGGGSGLATAATAAKLGSKILLVEKGPQLGGTTAWSVGSFTSSDTPHQHRSGVHDDNPERHFQDLFQVNGASNFPDNLVLNRVLTAGSPISFRWLMSLGVEFIGPNPEVNHTRPRMHNVVPGPGAYIHFVGREARKHGVEIRLSTRLHDLVQEDGKVVGVELIGPDGKTETVRSHHGVVLASGDYSASTEMRSRYFAPEVVRAEPVNKLSTGETIELGERYGGRIVNGGFGGAYIPKMRFVPPEHKNWLQRLPPNRLVSTAMQLGWRFLPQPIVRPFLMRFITTALGPEGNLFQKGAMLVDSTGAGVAVDPKSLARELALGPVNKGYIVFDGPIGEMFRKWPNFISTAPNVAYAYLGDYASARKDVFNEAPTLAELAEKLGMPASKLSASIEAHNQKQPDPAKKLKTGPFYALGPVRGYITTTNGGLAVNTSLQVLDADDQPIPGLYAAGSAGQGGMILGGHGHHIGWAFVSGRHVAHTALGVKPEIVVIPP